MTPLVVGVTSHRDISASEIEPIRQRVRDFFARLQRDFPGLPLVVLSALAEGGDQLVAEEALAAGARLVAPLPLPPDLYAEDFVDPAVRARFDTLCSQAEVVLLPGLMDAPRHAIEAPGAARDRQYAKAGVYVASHSHVLLAIWNGQPKGRLGGTAQIVNYHLTGTLPGLIDQQRLTRHVLGGGDESLLYHIVCSRSGADGAPVADLRPLQAGWRSAGATGLHEHMPAEFRLMFAHMEEFNTDAAKHAAQIVAAAPVPHNVTSGSTTQIDHLFHAADWLAIHFRKRVLLAMRLIYTLAALMGIAFALYAHLPAGDYLIYVFLLMFAGGGYVATLARRRGWHRKYLDYRALAEGLRVQAYWWRAGVSTSAEHEFAHDNFLQRQDIELGWIRNVMRAASLYTSSHAEAGTPTALAAVIEDWVGRSGVSGQLHYYECKTVERTRLHHVTETVGSISLWGGIAISVYLAVFALVLAEDTKIALVMSMAVLSIIAAVRESYAYRKADRELIRQYRFMQRIFAGARAALDRTHDPSEQRGILLSLGDAALTEHAEWTLMQRERQVEHSKF